MTSSPTAEVPVPVPPIKKEKEMGKKRKKRLIKKAQPQHNSGESSGDNIYSEKASFNEWKVDKSLVDGCILPNIMDRIVLTDLEQWMKDSLGAFLKVGHQLITNIKAINIQKAKPQRLREYMMNTRLQSIVY
ncbi:hypothetical protein COCNU_scaffold004613G000010 [Cocos nucifera]|nr:hypothetical protein [Cocos nucifera]